MDVNSNRKLIPVQFKDKQSPNAFHLVQVKKYVWPSEEAHLCFADIGHFLHIFASDPDISNENSTLGIDVIKHSDVRAIDYGIVAAERSKKKMSGG